MCLSPCKDVAPLSYKNTQDALTTKVYHGVSITVGTGTIVGRIQSWQPDAYTREGVHLYELSDKATGFTISVTRAEVWGAEMEKAFTQRDELFDDLIDQSRPFTVREFWVKGDSGASQTWEYRGCWFQNKNIDAITSDGDGITRISATLAYVSRRLTAVT